jgi:hypothetical protein
MSAIRTALLCFVISGCGVEIRSYTFEATAASSAGDVAIFIAATREHQRFPERLHLGAPYRLRVKLGTDGDGSRAFELGSVVLDHDGAVTTIHALDEAPLSSRPTDPPSADNASIVTVPLPDSTFVADSTVVVTVQTRLAPEEPWRTSTRSFNAVAEEKDYSGCQQISMH